MNARVRLSSLLAGIMALSLGATSSVSTITAARSPEPISARHSTALHPTIAFSTYLGDRAHAGDTQGSAVAVDGSGNVYVLGLTTAGQAHQTIVVTKYDPRGTKVLYNTLLSGACDQQAGGLALDRAGNAYVTGQYESRDAYGNCTVRQALVAKLAPSGAVAYSVHFGKAGLNAADVGRGIAVDGQGNAYVTGESNLDPGFPVTPSAFQRTCTVVCAFVLKVDPSGALVYATFLSGNDTAKGQAIAVDARGEAYVAGETTSTQFPTTANAYEPTLRTVTSGLILGAPFVTKLNASGSALLYSTYLGGKGSDRPHAITLDAGGNAYVTGQASSVDFPTTQNAYSRALRLAPGVCGQAGSGLCASRTDAFVAEIDPDPALPAKRTLVYATYFGGALDEVGTAIAVDSARHVYVTGATDSWNTFPTVRATQPSPGAGKNYLAATMDAFVATFDLAQSGRASLVFSTYLGGSADDAGSGIALDRTGNVYVVGTTRSRDFPLHAPAPGRVSGSMAGFLVKVTLGLK